MQRRHVLNFASESELSTVAFASPAEEDSVSESIRVCFAFELLLQQQQGWGCRRGECGFAMLFSHH